MKKLLGILIVTILLSGMASAAPSFLCTTGGILAPDDLVIEPGEFNASIHMLRLEGDAITFGANVGVTEELELGIARFDPDLTGVSAATLLNGKYRVLAETPSLPSVVIGVVDAAGDLDPDGDPGFYIVLGKNLTSFATNVTGEPAMPLKGYVGFGMGIYDGVFAGVNWAFSPRASVVAEFINELNMVGGVQDKTVFNAGVRFAISENIRGDVALINAEDFAVGVSYTAFVQ